MTRLCLLLSILPLVACSASADTFTNKDTTTSGGTWTVELIEGPYLTGWHTLEVYVVDDGGPATGLDFEADVSMPSMGHGSTEDVETTETSDGSYEVEAYFQMAGAWRIDGSFSDPSNAAENFDFDFEVESN